jgi:hypothetical protein
MTKDLTARLVLLIHGKPYTVKARATQTAHVVGGEIVLEFDILEISRDGWDGHDNLKMAMETIYEDPDLYANVCEALNRAGEKKSH